MRKAELPPRLFLQDGYFYWKVERKLRPKWRGAALGKDPRLAIIEAKRLNKAAEEWLAKQAGAPATKSRVRLGPSTVGQIISKYKESEDWRRLEPSTRATYTYEFRRLEDEFGHEVAATLSLSRVDDWLETLRREAPGTARHVLAKGRLLFAWAQRKEHVATGVNPFLGQRRHRGGRDTKWTQGGKRKARFTWDEVQSVVAAADAAGVPSIGTALVIGFACVQRITDVIDLREKHVVGGRLKFRQRKTGFNVDMELPAIVAARLAAAPPLRTGTHHLIVSEETGVAYHEKTVSRVFKRLLDSMIGPRLSPIAGKQLRDGRRSGFVQYVLDGVSVPFICSMSGHSIEVGMSIVEHYLPKTPEQADRAVKALSVKWG
ncbi:MAG TPA: hypothetical protein VN715_04900 [Roseiarcus sp.]|nr:hypothetical protein [Roseiarcus sp.]